MTMAITAMLSQPEPQDAAALAQASQQVVQHLLQAALQASQTLASLPQAINLASREQHAAWQQLLTGLLRVKAILSQSGTFKGQAAAAAASAAQQQSLGQLAIEVGAVASSLTCPVHLQQLLMWVVLRCWALCGRASLLLSAHLLQTARYPHSWPSAASWQCAAMHRPSAGCWSRSAALQAPAFLVSAWPDFHSPWRWPWKPSVLTPLPAAGCSRL